MDVKHYMQQLGQQARQAGREVSKADTGFKNKALLNIANTIAAGSADLVIENRKDLQAGKDSGLDAASLDRLELTPGRIEAMVEGLKQVAALPDPVGEITDLSYRPSGIQVGRMRVPLGVIGIIYESRPNVTVNAAALCLKAGNACILRGGSESIHSIRGRAFRFFLSRASFDSLRTRAFGSAATASSAACAARIGSGLRASGIGSRLPASASSR